MKNFDYSIDAKGILKGLNIAEACRAISYIFGDYITAVPDILNPGGINVYRKGNSEKILGQIEWHSLRDIEDMIQHIVEVTDHTSMDEIKELAGILTKYYKYIDNPKVAPDNVIFSPAFQYRKYTAGGIDDDLERDFPFNVRKYKKGLDLMSKIHYKGGRYAEQDVLRDFSVGELDEMGRAHAIRQAEKEKKRKAKK